MFDRLFADEPDEALVAVIEQAAREEHRAAARRFAAIAEFVHRTVDDDDERGDWAFDPWNNTAAHVGAALSIGQRRASGQMRIAVALRDRLPRVAALFCQGLISARLISEITWRTHLVEDHEVLALVDAALADRAAKWGPLSAAKLIGAIESVIARYDPDAVRRAQEIIRTRDFRIGACDDPNEIVAVHGQLSACDGEVFEARISALLKGICEADPRTAGELRSDAAGAVVQGVDRLTCRCGSPDCPAAGPGTTSVVIHVIADQAAVDSAQDLIAKQDREHQSKKDAGVAIRSKGRVLPTPALAEAIRNGARFKPLWVPGPDPEPHYRPSAKLAEFVRTRDLFCRFPGCDVPAEHCDIDHVVPWPHGPTHASNLNCKCRNHHLAKTFWDGYRDVQLSTGEVIWTTPEGQTYRTMPASRLYFPAWDTTTAELPPMAQPPPDPLRRLRAPRRRRARAADTAARIKAERAENAAQQPPPV
ncbi:HNH endonuclease signature motif containing protein [Mycobacterium sp. SMC-4]|uniref:HNH endonuclease signature motif containing protein n=1 Tax=Mycobacterium sp. SMC-4 TaxID=2857059 RepID=UPI0021B41CAF|nr:HNH endonuclease signature motif containing protein [Mycobacterium sp. SMC-4]UXA18912.1 HNH endonuclease [Mycobacterium sp. SMC-4]